MDDIEKNAEVIAREAHAGQFRRGGLIPYIEHPRAVVSRLKGPAELKAVAWLHDVLEDSSLTAEDLCNRGMPRQVVDAVCVLTKVPGCSYEDYLQSVAANSLARKVKVADMLSNLADTPTRRQIRKYARGLLKLTEET